MLPCAADFAAVDGAHGITGSPAVELIGSLDGAGQRSVAEAQQVSGRAGIVEHVEGQAVGFGVPPGASVIGLAGEPLGGDVQTLVHAVIGLVELKDAEPYALLIGRVAVDGDVEFRPDVAQNCSCAVKKKSNAALPFGSRLNSFSVVLVLSDQNRGSLTVLSRWVVLTTMRSRREVCPWRRRSVRSRPTNFSSAAGRGEIFWSLSRRIAENTRWPLRSVRARIAAKLPRAVFLTSVQRFLPCSWWRTEKSRPARDAHGSGKV